MYFGYQPSRFRWLDHVSGVANTTLLHHVLFPVPLTEWKKACEVQQIRSQCGMKKHTRYLGKGMHQVLVVVV